MAVSLPVVNLSMRLSIASMAGAAMASVARMAVPAFIPMRKSALLNICTSSCRNCGPKRKLIHKEGYLSNRRKGGLPMLRVSAGWCVFFNQGCVLHKVGGAEGDKYRYKPAPCSLFPLARKDNGDWYVRQHGVEGEEWDIFCLNAQASPRPAADSLADEIALAGATPQRMRQRREAMPSRLPLAALHNPCKAASGNAND